MFSLIGLNMFKRFKDDPFSQFKQTLAFKHRCAETNMYSLSKTPARPWREAPIEFHVGGSRV